MHTLFEHQKRPTVPGTLHGTINQITKAMFHAFINAYNSKIDFYVVTEDTAFGDFDDLVLITSEGKITAIQYKHNKSGTEIISTNDLITLGGGNKELMLHKYYKSIVKERPQWENEPKLTLELASNCPIDQNLGMCIDPHTKGFTQDFLVGNTSFQAFMRRVIIASILKHNDKLSVKNPKTLDSYLKYLELLLVNHAVNTNLLDDLFQVFKKRGQNFQTDQQKIAVINKAIQNLKKTQEITDEVWEKLSKLLEKTVFPHSGITHFNVINANECLEKNKVIKFLGKLKFSYSEPSKDRTISEIKKKLSIQFELGNDATDILYNAFFYYFMEWLGSENAIHITNVDIKNKFTEWLNRLLLQQWIGISNAYQQNLVTKIDGAQFERPELIGKLSDFKESEKRALVVFGDRGMGKSTLIHQYIMIVKKLDSDCLMLDINTILKSLSSLELINRCSFDFFHACQIIAIENCEDLINYPEKIIKLFEELLSRSPKNIKFIFSFRGLNFNLGDKLFGISNDLIELIEMPKLDKKDIVKIFPFIFNLFEPSSQLTFHQKKQQNPLLDSLIYRPFYLKLLVMYYKKNGSLNVDFSSKDDFIKEILESLLTVSQLSVIRRLVYLISQSKETAILETTSGYDLKALMNQGIVIEEESSYQFSHKLYEEWALRAAIEMRLTCMIESNEDVILIYQDIIRSLPSSQKAIFIYLGENSALREYRHSFSPLIGNQIFIENNNICFLKNLIANKNYAFFQDTKILYVLVDSDPEGLLNLLLDMTNILSFPVWLGNDKFKQDFYTILIRSFCIAKDTILAGKLFYQILNKLDQFGLSKNFDSLYYMEHFFENAFAASQSPGFMALDQKLYFLKFHCNSINSLSSQNEQIYFQYVYKGLLKAADPNETGDALYPEHRCYFGCDNNHGYVNYKGEYFGFNAHTLEARADYHCRAARILVDFYNREKKLVSTFLDHQDILRDIKNIFEITLANVVFGDGTYSLNIINVANVIAAEIFLDESLLEVLKIHLLTGYDLQLMLVDSTTLPTMKELSAQKKMPLLMKWNDDFYIYGLSEEGKPHLIKLDSNAELKKLEVKNDSRIYVSADKNSGIWKEITLKKGHNLFAKDFLFNAIYDPEQVYEFKKRHLSQIQTILEWRKENQYQIFELEKMPPLLSEVSVVKKIGMQKNSNIF